MERIEALIETHGQRLMRLLRSMLADPGLAEDAWQETWGAVWTALPRLQRGRDPWPFLKRTAVRKAIDVVRRAPGRLLTGSHPEPASPIRPAPVEVELGFLPEDQRKCLVMFFWEGLSVGEIAARLGVPEGTVKTWMFRGRAMLRERLRKNTEDR